jgi:hypothetical protein
VDADGATEPAATAGLQCRKQVSMDGCTVMT